MKIIIIGAGLSGLTTALALQKYIQPQLPDDETLEIQIYDEAPIRTPGEIEYSWRDHSDIRRDQQQQQQKEDEGGGKKRRNHGAAISLQPNAFKVLREIDRDLADRVYASGLPTEGFTWKSRGGWVLGREDLEAFLVSRPVVVRCLMDALSLRGTRVVYRTVRDLEIREAKKPVVHFEDGGKDEVADLVVGADGIRSPVRKSLFGNGEGVRPIYLGNCAVGGVLSLPRSTPLSESHSADPRITFIHGPTGTFGYGGLSQTSPDQIIYFSFYDTDLPARGSKPDPLQVTEALRKRHQGWEDPMVARCLEKADAIDTVYPIFYMPDLPSWGRDGCVLVGDAAHAMTPATGQGGSQAFEDGLTLGLLLAKLLEIRRGGDQGAVVEESIRGLYAIRAQHVHAIKKAGLAIKEPARPWGWGTTLAVYGFYFVMTKVKWLRGWFGQPIYPAHLFDARAEVERYVAVRP